VVAPLDARGAQGKLVEDINTREGLSVSSMHGRLLQSVLLTNQAPLYNAPPYSIAWLPRVTSIAGMHQNHGLDVHVSTPKHIRHKFGSIIAF
jgi:hypothetical protein